MPEATLAPPPSGVRCPTCQARVEAIDVFCPGCGHGLQDGATPRPVTPSLGSLADGEHRRHIRSARIAILFVAVVTLGMTAFLWHSLQSEVAKIEADPTMVADQAVVRESQITIAALGAIGLLFVGLFFWAGVNPFAATLTALCVYVGGHLIDAAMDPSALSRGILIKFIFVVILARGVQAGLAYRRSLARGLR